MAKVARATSIPIAAGERLATKYDFAKLIEAQAAAILQPDLGRLGSLLEARKVAGMAEAHYLQMAPHVWGGPLIAAASIQLDFCCPTFIVQESISDFQGFYAELLTEPIEWKDGFILPPERPGLGYELDEEVARAHPVD
jgi:L-alanine-DL-glutamate epimerase-like enolase superfamily enzyme